MKIIILPVSSTKRNKQEEGETENKANNENSDSPPIIKCEKDRQNRNSFRNVSYRWPVT